MIFLLIHHVLVMENMGPLLVRTPLVSIHKNDNNVKYVIVVLLIYICPFHDVHWPPLFTFWKWYNLSFLESKNEKKTPN
jgi:hypothetical protein